jgi:hypothetical protein
MYPPPLTEEGRLLGPDDNFWHRSWLLWCPPTSITESDQMLVSTGQPERESASLPRSTNATKRIATNFELTTLPRAAYRNRTDDLFITRAFRCCDDLEVFSADLGVGVRQRPLAHGSERRRCHSVSHSHLDRTLG